MFDRASSPLKKGTKNEMKIFLVVVSVLLSAICVLLALLQHYYLISRLQKRPSLKYHYFEDLIPSDKYQYTYALQTVDDRSDDDRLLDDLNAILEKRSYGREEQQRVIKNDRITEDGIKQEVYNALQAAVAFKHSGKKDKALKLFEHATAIAPDDPDVLNSYGEFLEQDDVLTADELYFKALTRMPEHEAALTNRKRTAQVVDGLDYLMFKHLDERNDFLKTRMKMEEYENVKRQAYYLHIYHTVGIEGNTMTVQQMRYLLETGLVVTGKSLLEHNEILGLEKAMQYIKLLVRKDEITVQDILGVHRRVMGHVDPITSGVFRDEKVFIASHSPPPHQEVPYLMEAYVDWLNSDEAHSMHPVRFAALAHYKLVDVHPFVDGNGRTSRLIMNLILLKAGYPPVMVLKEQRERYYDTLKAANMGDIRPFVRFIARCTLQIIDMYIYGTKFLSIEGEGEERNPIVRL